MISIGDYAFVHAGVDPVSSLEEQSREHLRWIREPFLSHTDPYEKVVVHGHSIADDPQDMGNRIGIDTGAYMSGRLTALVLEGTGRRYIETCTDDGGAIAIRHRASGK
jgi:serine/threonine protein phosphatase 1